MTDRPDCTIIVMTYNQQDFVAEAIRSVLAQEGPPLDILISDDCSTDRSFAVAEATVAGYSGPHRVEMNRNPVNLGITAHLNRCIALAQGEILIVAAGDDISLPQRARRIRDTFAETDALLVHSRVEVFPPITPARRLPHDRALFLRSTDLAAAATSIALYIGATGAWHRDLFRKYGPLPDRDVYEDLILGFRAALEGRVAFIDEALVRYRFEAGVSQADSGPLTPGAWRGARLRALRRNRAVMAQRLVDAHTYGMQDSDPVVRRLRRELALQQTRADVHEQPVLTFLRRHAASPAVALHALVSECRRTRRALRAASG